MILKKILLILAIAATGCGETVSGNSTDFPENEIGSNSETDDTPTDADSGSFCSIPAEYSPVITQPAATGNGFPEDPVDLEVRADIGEFGTLWFTTFNDESVPLGKHEMTGQWLDATCVFCLFVNYFDPQIGQEELWFPISGEIEIISVEGDFILEATNIIFQQVVFKGDTLNLEAAPHGCQTLFPSFTINTPTQVGQ
jgi:hypothetical protein